MPALSHFSRHDVGFLCSVRAVGKLPSCKTHISTGNDSEHPPTIETSEIGLRPELRLKHYSDSAILCERCLFSLLESWCRLAAKLRCTAVDREC
eukprot:8877835-Pyramimonas_sp.AAC.1